ncbi:MAG: COX15/CtaA family protein [Planctomycetota bacterium]
MIHRLAWISLISVIVLVAVGATVRVTGSGLGCPDWPTCWGCLIPPISADQIDVEKLDLEKFKRHAARKGIDPDTITKETILESFNPVHTWIEFVNRLTSLPLGFSTLFLAFGSFTAKRHRKVIIGLAWFSLLDVLFNAAMGAMVVRSGLKPGIITLHMALAFLLIAVLVTIVWLTRPEKMKTSTEGEANTKSRPVFDRKLLIVSFVFFGCLFGEGLLGSQLREQTDELARLAEGMNRSQWVDQLIGTLIFKLHRSLSWTLLISSALMVYWSRNLDVQYKEPRFILGMVVLMMLMGIILGHVAIYSFIQVAHVVVTAILLAVTWHWIVRLLSSRWSNRTIIA